MDKFSKLNKLVYPFITYQAPKSRIFETSQSLSSFKQLLFSSFHRGDQRKKNQKLVNPLFYVSLYFLLHISFIHRGMKSYRTGNLAGQCSHFFNRNNSKVHYRNLLYQRQNLFIKRPCNNNYPPPDFKTFRRLWIDKYMPIYRSAHEFGLRRY